MKFQTSLRASRLHSEQIGSPSNLADLSQRYTKCTSLDSRTCLGSRAWRPCALVALIVSSWGVTGCGNSLYLVQVNRAERNFQEAKQLEAERYAPYEYYSAKVRLEEAKRQAADAEYGNAADLSDEATDFSNQAILLSKKAKAQSTNTETTK